MKIPYPTLLFCAVLFLGLSCLALLSPLRVYAKPGTALAATLSPTPGTKSSDIMLEVTAEPSLVKPRDTLTIKVIVKNTLSRRISGILVTEAIPDFLQLISLKTDVGTNVVKNNTIIFSMTLAAQQVATLTILARVRPTI